MASTQPAVSQVMKPEDLWRYYPNLYHIAWGGSWPSIKEHGLLSTKALLKSCKKSDNEIMALTRKRRPCWVEIDCPGRSRVVLRDQKPMTDSGIRRALDGSAEPWQWYDLLSTMVFFWATKDKLKRMILSYKEIEHDVLIIDTKILVQLEEPNIRLSRMNSGSTQRSHPRNMNLFKRIKDYPFKDRLKSRGKRDAVAEVCVLERVEKIQEAVIDIQHGMAKDILEKLA